MAWADKLPSLKGITAFFYVATHWGTISEDLEEYRRQIRDREEWARKMLEGQEELHQLDRKRLEQELVQWKKGAEAWSTLTEKYEAITTWYSNEMGETIPLLAKLSSELVDAIWLLAQLLSRESPLVRALLLASLKPRLQERIQTTMAELPPPAPEAAQDLTGFAKLRGKILADLLAVPPTRKPGPAATNQE